ncbi:MAG: single-stranded-DNA-specific exonuclease RecJ [Clostridia bacterium]|jgi:single-stranded-DNA-specific exonuclease RecJ|nr:single-stranded-DNA-specific exonuclease RecJ [Clostridia bacterium]
MIFKKFFNVNADKVHYFAEKFNLSPRICDLILSRGISSDEEFEEYLNPKVLHDPFLLKGMQGLVDRVKLAKELKDKVVIFGDYDVDGVSATAIMLGALAEFGIKADYYLPNRYLDGYGLTNAVIDKVYDLFQPNLIITVDCGVSCANEVEYAKTKGIEIVVTDHHEIPEILPDTIVVNAKQEDQEYPFKELCGTGVAYKFAEALLGKVKAETYLPIASIATIVDIVPLKGENRTIVSKGFKLCEKYLPIGLKMMFKEYGLNLKNPNSTSISFKIGPKLNASGRMGDASDSLKIYLEKDPVTIKKYLDKIKKHNLKRQDICNRIFDDCEKALKKVDMKNQRVITLASKHWDKGVLGIVCSRLVEKYHKPVFLFVQEGELLCGSGRSIDDINIHELLSSLKDILVTFGGHSMAAGLTLKLENYKLFSQKINSFALTKINDSVFMPIEYYDQEVEAGEITNEFVKELAILEPVGCSNPRPRFKITTQEMELTPMKRASQHANIKIGNLKLVYFNYLDNLIKINFSRQKSFIFELETNSTNGTVVEFDGGSFIVENAYKKLNAIEMNQFAYESSADAKYTMYPKTELLNFVGATTNSVFGTCFVTYSCFEYVEFCKNYNTQSIYHFGIYDNRLIGYNTVLLAPKGIAWAKNFSKIVFLSPVVDEKFLAALNKVTDAEVFVPIEKEGDPRKFAGLDVSRNCFGKVYKELLKFNGKTVTNLFNLYDSTKITEQVSFFTFYAALMVFNELGILSIDEEKNNLIKINSSIKVELNQSKIYNNIILLKETLKGEAKNGKFGRADIKPA